MKSADKVCPVVFRDASMQQVLAFEHPLAGRQFVKGSIEVGETVRAAALRELEEESGIANAGIACDLGTWDPEHKGHLWSLHLCTFSPHLPENWVHHCLDDGGHNLEFFWHDVNNAPGDSWHPQYHRALSVIRERTRALRWRG